MIKVMCWNVAKRYKPLDQLAEMDADVALLQEVGSGMAVNLPFGMETGRRAHWDSRLWSSISVDRWPIVVKLSDRVDVEWFDQVGPGVETSGNEIALSDVGLLAVAKITLKDQMDGQPFIAASMHANFVPQNGVYPYIRKIANDLRTLGERTDLPILAAGDLNEWYKWGAFEDMRRKEPVDTDIDSFGYFYRIYNEGEWYTVVAHRPNGEAFYIWRKQWKTDWGARGWCRREMERHKKARHAVASGEMEYPKNFWDEMASVGLEFMGPQYPNGRQACPTPEFLPSDTKNVITYTRPSQPVKDAEHQLDYVFASRGFHDRVKTRALNSVEDWGASDHCRIMIEVGAE